MNKHFCTCPNTKCVKYPANHDHGCDPCVKSNLEQGKMPSCFFIVVNEDVSDVKDYSIKGFVDFYLKKKQ